jgi:hypothetical protein
MHKALRKWTTGLLDTVSYTSVMCNRFDTTKPEDIGWTLRKDRFEKMKAAVFAKKHNIVVTGD